MVELGVTARMLGTIAGLTRRLQAVAHLVQQHTNPAQPRIAHRYISRRRREQKRTHNYPLAVVGAVDPIA